MTTNIQLLRSGIAYKRPSAAPLLDGQAAINFNSSEPGLFWRLTNGQLAKAGPVAITDDGTIPNSAPAGETGNAVGEEWLDQHPALHAPLIHVFNGTEFVTANGFTVDKSTGNFTLLRELEITKLIASSGQIDGELVVGGNITPNGQNCAFYLGLPNERWDYLYGCNFNISFDGLVGQDLTVDRDTILQRDLTVGREVKSDLIPDVGATRYLGFSNQRWLLFAENLDVNGNIQLGENCSDTLTIDATSTFNCLATFNNGINLPGGDLTVDGNLTVKGNTNLGDSCTDTLTVFATTTFKCAVDFEQPIDISQIGNNCTDTLTVNATTTFKCPVDFEVPIDISQIGTSCTDTLTVNATTTFKCPVTFESPLDISQIGNTCSDTLTINATTTVKCLSKFEGGIELPSGNLDITNNLTVKGNTVLGDGCNNSTIHLNGAVTLSCDVLPNSNNTRSIGVTGNRLANLFSNAITAGSLTVDNKATSAATVDADPDTTLVTKGYLNSKITPSTGPIVLGSGCAQSTINLNGAVTLSCDMAPNLHNTRSIGTNTNRLLALYATDVYTGDLHLKNDKGDWTMIEAEDYLTIRNNKTGKTFRLLMEEV